MSLAPKDFDFDKKFDEVWSIIIEILTEDYSRYNPLIEETTKFINTIDTVERFMEKFKHGIEKHVELLNAKIPADDLLYHYATCCTRFYKGMYWVDRACDIINRNYVNSTADIRNDRTELRDVGIKTWVKLVIESQNPKLFESLTAEIEKCINNLRDEGHINYDKELKLLQQTINSFLGTKTKPERKHVTMEDVKLQTKVSETSSERCRLFSYFQKDYVAKTKIYYENLRRKSKTFIDDNGPDFYVEKISRWYEMEKKILDSLFIQEEKILKFFLMEKDEMKSLSTGILERVIIILEQTMVDENIEYVKEGLAILTKREDETVLSKVYDVLKVFKGKGLTELAKIVEKHITDIGNKGLEKIDRDNDDPIYFVNEALSIYSKYSNMISVCFKDNHFFIKARDKAVCSFLNAKHNNRSASMSAQYLAKYYDKILKQKGDSDKLDVTLFKYLDDKDLFERCYAKYLAKRLITGSSPDSDKEEKVISKFTECSGYEYSRKFHQIYKDKGISDDLNSKFVEHLKGKDKNLYHKFVPHVMSQGSWPFSIISTPDFILPIMLEESLSEFEAFYKGLFKGRKLIWVYDMSTVDIQLTYTKQCYTATMSVFQSAILKQFESKEELSYSQLLGAINLKDQQGSTNQLLRNLNGLIEQKILICNATDKSQLHPDTPIRLNLMFENTKAKFKVPLPQPPRTFAKGTEDKLSLDKERMFYLEAVIVRIMKVNKSMTRNALIKETIDQARSRFRPGVKFINNAIQRLLQKEYIESPENNVNTFKYVA